MMDDWFLLCGKFTPSKINDRNLVVYGKGVWMNARGWMNLVDAEVFLVLFALIVKEDILAGREPELQHILQHHSARGKSLKLLPQIQMLCPYVSVFPTMLRIRDPGTGAFLTENPSSFCHRFRCSVLTYLCFQQWCGSGIREGKNSDPGWKTFGSGIRDKHPGSATHFYNPNFLFFKDPDPESLIYTGTGSWDNFCINSYIQKRYLKLWLELKYIFII